ncbi:protein APEM9 isoform X1 [Lycium barbarum]|uniref:protein APEM9 isoform X1 n=1 Tax=Lycium barbarum TaxID=112863 RepID=UPI00293EA8D6|nr:protein APEM9 isoform X1 [Lycium barbarum]
MATWEQIELSERYLVCCMFEEAASLSSSIIEQLVEKNGKTNEEDNWELLESAGMVFVQSSKELGRTSEILKQLVLLFGSVTAIPAQVFLTGYLISWTCYFHNNCTSSFSTDDHPREFDVSVFHNFVVEVCLQIPDGPSAEVQEILQEFLRKWKHVDGKYYTVASMEADVPNIEEFSNQISLGVDKYLQIVELYVITFLGRFIGNLDLAISWVEKAALPEEKRQDLLRRLHSMNTLKLGSSSQSSELPLQVDECTTDSTALIEETSCNGTANILEHKDQSKGENTTKQSLMELSRRRTPFWWFRTITLKFGSSRLVLSNGSIFLGFLAALVYYILRRKQASLWSVLKRQASSTKKALVDFWQLAFSYQVNPLAAVQPLPPATRGSR